jgi:hypothetical protein
MGRRNKRKDTHTLNQQQPAAAAWRVQTRENAVCCVVVVCIQFPKRLNPE